MSTAINVGSPTKNNRARPLDYKFAIYAHTVTPDHTPAVQTIKQLVFDHVCTGCHSSEYSSTKTEHQRIFSNLSIVAHTPNTMPKKSGRRFRSRTRWFLSCRILQALAYFQSRMRHLLGCTPGSPAALPQASHMVHSLRRHVFLAALNRLTRMVVQQSAMHNKHHATAGG